ncbi:E3 ubiquitin-protein ligase CHFR [Metarhizium brunneum]|uniref:E3 ubiquitin-protein ligase CHFR n=1 Tax=Metarhizium brunneum TaxID=500148 RepID=A0A7D5UQJ0_9HYPO|nr:E3 ubiquitin-protein ligase CHFR [Metarhizium brunneum]
MDSRKPSLDLEKELTCSICTELLYQPLTLLDCLHTFCGACLKEWFRFQAAKAEKAPTPPAPGEAIFTCPSCRSPVRDTRHNATVVTLLDMYVAANPAKARSDVDKEEMQAKYKPGDQVLPKINTRERTAEERRADEEDRRLIDEVREMSLREATPGGLSQRDRRRRQRQTQSVDGRSRSSRDQSSSSRRRGTEHTTRNSRSDDSSRPGSDHSASDREQRRRRRRSVSRQRQVEHQTSLRSLIGSSEMSERDIEREIEDFARQIQEEGLLDGLDLDNIDLSRDDDLSRRITEAYRRRQRERSRNESSRQPTSSSNNAASRNSEGAQTDARLRAPEGGSRSRASSRSTNGGGQAEDRSRPPPTGSTNLEVRDAARRPRRRTASGGRSATTPVFSSTAETRPAARSSTDLGLRSRTSDPTAPRHSFSEGRSSSTPSVPASSQAPIELPASASSNSNIASFANRVPQWNPNIADPSPATTHELPAAQISRPHLPAELAIVHSAVSSPMSSPSATSGHRRTKSQLFPEPSISCAKCNKQHIEYELHYNCGICTGGQWNICLDCYRAGKGCQYWFGFGYGAWKKWENLRQKGDDSLAKPHMLTACRYLPPPSTPGGADGRKTLTTDDPRGRLETGTFCARCFTWTNDCYWRCDVCNEGDWGFCNNCVNQGNSCTHPLLPLTHEALQAASRPHSPRSTGRPPAATVYTGPQAANIGPFKPLTFRTRCDICQDPISPSHVRYHCFSCKSALIPEAPPGDYDICSSCYNSLVSTGQISMENGHSGWRRCLRGHKMAVIGFADGKIGQWRFIERDIVGGRVLRSEAFESPERNGQELQKSSWKNGDEKLERLVTKDVSATAPSTVGSLSFTQTFPLDGGTGMRANARWAWYPQAGSDDELLFPKGAEIREIEDVNGDWFFGTYMGAKGLFPAPYVRLGQRM